MVFECIPSFYHLPSFSSNFSSLRNKINTFCNLMTIGSPSKHFKDGTFEKAVETTLQLSFLFIYFKKQSFLYDL